MMTLSENDDDIQNAEKTAVAGLITAAGASRVCTQPDPSIPRDLVPIAELSIQDNPNCGNDRGVSGKRSYDELAEEGKKKGGPASKRGSHKYSTRRNYSNRGSSHSGTPPSTQGLREEIMNQWRMEKPWPSGPSFVSDSLTEEARNSRGLASLSVLASIGTGFAVGVQNQNEYPQQILIEEQAEATNEVSTQQPVDG